MPWPPPPPTSRLISARLMPPLDPGAFVVTIARSGRPTASSPALRTRACEPRSVSGRRLARLAKLSRNARMPFDFTCSRVSTSSATVAGLSVDSGTTSSGGGTSSATCSGSGSGSGISSSICGCSTGGGGGGNSSRTSLATRSGNSVTRVLSTIGNAIELRMKATSNEAASEEPSDFRKRWSSS